MCIFQFLNCFSGNFFHKKKLFRQKTSFLIFKSVSLNLFNNRDFFTQSVCSHCKQIFETIFFRESFQKVSFLNVFFFFNFFPKFFFKGRFFFFKVFSFFFRKVFFSKKLNYKKEVIFQEKRVFPN